MRVELRTGMPVEKFAAFVEMAWLERRPELGLLCRAAAEADTPITPELVQSILPGVSEPGARNIQRWTAYLGLCDRRGGLIGLGDHVAETDEVPVPEQGVYAIWAATHPLLGNRVLHMRRLASQRDQRFDEIVPLPFELDRDLPMQSLKDRSRRFLLRDLRPNHGVAGCIRRPCNSDLSIRWIWDMDSASDRWELDGRLDAGSLPDPIQHEAESANAEVRALFASLADGELRSIGTWDRLGRTLSVSFEDLDSDAVETFRLGTQLQRVQVRGYGIFDQIHIEEIPLVPASDRDAQEWSVARLASKLVETGYRTREDVRRLWAERVEDTPLEPFGPALPSHTEMLEAAADNLAAYWSLAAPVDLSPVPVPTDALVIAILIVIATSYSILAGLWGVVATDFIQIIIAMIGSFVLAGIALGHVGGLSGLNEAFADNPDIPARVVAPTSVKRGSSSLIDFACGPSPIMMSIL